MPYDSDNDGHLNRQGHVQEAEGVTDAQRVEARRIINSVRTAGTKALDQLIDDIEAFPNHKVR